MVRGVGVICVAFNARNAYGGYAGIYRHPFEIRGDQLIPAERTNRVDSGTCHQPEIVWWPFPELAAIR